MTTKREHKAAKRQKKKKRRRKGTVRYSVVLIDAGPKVPFIKGLREADPRYDLKTAVGVINATKPLVLKMGMTVHEVVAYCDTIKRHAPFSRFHLMENTET